MITYERAAKVYVCEVIYSIPTDWDAGEDIYIEKVFNTREKAEKFKAEKEAENIERYDEPMKIVVSIHEMEVE